MKIKLLLLLFLWLPLPSYAAPAILVLGDSLSAAYGMEQKDGWVELLRRRLEEQHYNYTIVNASVSGETTRGARTRIAGLLARHRPAVVIVELGGNDGLRGLSLRDMQDNLAGIIDTARRRKAKILLIGMHLPPNYGAAYTEAFQGVYQRLAQTYRIPWVPFLLANLGDDRNLFQPDGIHPTAEAQPIILDNIWPHLQNLLPAAPATK